MRPERAQFSSGPRDDNRVPLNSPLDRSGNNFKRKTFGVAKRMGKLTGYIGTCGVITPTWRYKMFIGTSDRLFINNYNNIISSTGLHR